MKDGKTVSRVIALEEAFLHPKLFELFPSALRRKYAVIKERLDDVGPGRIARMDAAGIDMQVLSHVEPGVQFLDDPKLALSLSREINDWLHGVVREYPSRFAGFAMLPTQSPEDAADELERCVTELGFVGALVNGHTKGRYLDHESFSVLFDRAEALDVPIYIHPTDPPQAISDIYYAGHPALITGWGWPVETGTHLLKLAASGVFDRHPRLKILVGHMGELLPFCATRLNVALTMGEWLLAAQEEKGKLPSPKRSMEKPFSYYLRENIYVTTSGVFDLPVFECARAVLGIDNMLFSVDDPFQDNFAGIEFLRACRLSSQDREKFSHGNAERLLKLPTADGTRAPATGKGRIRAGASLYSLKARIKSKLGRALIARLVK
jgi:predicted TIM-barrel fold metal-dependent hydrolase